MFNFDFQRAPIYRAIKIEKGLLFQTLKILKIFLLIASLFFFIIFLINDLKSFQNIKTSIPFGLALILFSLTAPIFLIELFFNTKLKKPELPQLTAVSNLAEYLDFDTAKALNSAIKYARKNRIFPINPSLFFYFILRQNQDISLLLASLLLSGEEMMKKMPDFFFTQLSKDNLSERIYSQKFEQVIKIGRAHV